MNGLNRLIDTALLKLKKQDPIMCFHKIVIDKMSYTLINNKRSE